MHTRTWMTFDWWYNIFTLYLLFKKTHHHHCSTLFAWTKTLHRNQLEVFAPRILASSLTIGFSFTSSCLSRCHFFDVSSAWKHKVQDIWPQQKPQKELRGIDEKTQAIKTRTCKNHVPKFLKAQIALWWHQVLAEPGLSL